MLTSDQAADLATRWRPKFATSEAYAASVERYLDKIPGPARSAESCERWLREDADQQHVRGALLGDGPMENAPQRLADPIDDCTTCRGRRYVRVEVPHSDLRFGKAFRCPDCNGGLRSDMAGPVSDAEPARAGNWCWKCAAGEPESARDGCSNPAWHVTNGQPRATFDDVVKRF